MESRERDEHRQTERDTDRETDRETGRRTDIRYTFLMLLVLQQLNKTKAGGVDFVDIFSKAAPRSELAIADVTVRSDDHYSTEIPDKLGRVQLRS